MFSALSFWSSRDSTVRAAAGIAMVTSRAELADWGQDLFFFSFPSFFFSCLMMCGASFIIISFFFFGHLSGPHSRLLSNLQVRVSHVIIIWRWEVFFLLLLPRRIESLCRV